MPAARSSTLLEPTDEPMLWYGWGDPSATTHLPKAALRLLESTIGTLGGATPAVAFDDVRVAGSRLQPDQRAALAAVVGPTYVRDDRRERILRAGGKSYPDLVRRRAGDALGAPDAVVLPATHDEVAGVLGACAAHGVAVVPFGGGTSVVGGVEPERGGFDAVVTLDLSRMTELLDLDEISGIATFQPGLRGPLAERLLRRRGFTLGHFPQSYEYATLGGYVATRSAGQASTGYGRIDDMVVGVRCATPVGELRAGHATPSAAGPDLLGLLVGSEGTLGIFTEVSLRVRRAPETEVHEAWAAPSFERGCEAARALVQRGIAPDIVRLSDEDETRTTLAQAGGMKVRALRGYLGARGARRPSLLVLGWEGAAGAVADRRATARVALRGLGLVRVGRGAGAAWARHRFSGPYLRDALMDQGAMVETLETSASWSALPGLYAAVREALHSTMGGRGTPALVLCHVSHLYPTGASLYFTWIARRQRGGELEQWRAAKTAASDAIVGSGGTITHHHAVGTDHRPWMTVEVGDLGVAALRAVKERLDPQGIMNPGKLLPA